MIDNIEYKLLGLSSNIVEDGMINPIRRIDREGQVLSTSDNWHGLTIKTTPKATPRCFGSLHKIGNSLNGEGYQNFNQFSLANITNTLDAIENRFDTQENALKITSLEFGFNIKFEPIKKLVSSQIIGYIGQGKNKGIKEATISPRKGIECVHLHTSKNTVLKFYNKYLEGGKQGPRHNLRCEMSLKTEVLSKIGINTIRDLRNLRSYNQLFALFMNHLRSVQIIDSFEFAKDDLQEHQIKSFEMVSNIKRFKAQSFSRETRRKHKDRFLQVVKEKRLNKTYLELENKLMESYKGLTFWAFAEITKGLTFCEHRDISQCQYPQPNYKSTLTRCAEMLTVM